MKIGVFDSGLGGLVITRSFINTLPEYDYVYYGDTKGTVFGRKESTITSIISAAGLKL